MAAPIVYPTPRRDRGAAAAADGGPGGPSPPRARVIPFSLLATANTRSAISAGPFKGPALVRGLSYSKTGTPDGTAGVGLGKSSSPVSEASVAVAVTAPFTPLFEPHVAAGGPALLGAPASPVVDSQTSLVTDQAHVTIPILDVEFHLVVYAVAGATGGDTFHGYVTLLEAVDPAVLANFL